MDPQELLRQSQLLFAEGKEKESTRLEKQNGTRLSGSSEKPNGGMASDAASPLT